GLCRLVDALERLLTARDAAAFERVWEASHLDRMAWEVLALARRADAADAPPAPRAPLERALDQVDRRLLAVLDRCRALLERYLVTPGAHHAFVAAAVEAARYYPGHADVLVRLFERIRGDQLLRRFLGPKILESLYVLGESLSLPLFEELLVAGHTDPDVDRCEVTRALVAVR